MGKYENEDKRGMSFRITDRRLLYLSNVGINRFLAWYRDNFLLTTGKSGLNYLKYEFKNSPRTPKLNLTPYVYPILRLRNKKGDVN